MLLIGDVVAFEPERAEPHGTRHRRFVDAGPSGVVGEVPSLADVDALDLCHVPTACRRPRDDGQSPSACASFPLAEPERLRKLGRRRIASVKGILGRLFGGGSGGADDAKPGDAVEYNGFRVRPAPYSNGGQFQTAGVIEKDFPDGVKTHRFIRAETHASKDDAAAFAISKGKQIIDERGDKIFETK